MATKRHYTGFWVKDAITTIACTCSFITTLSACNDSTNQPASQPSPPLQSTPISPSPAEVFSLSSLLNSLEGAKSEVSEAVAPHADAVQARTREEVEKLFRWEYKVVDVPYSAEPTGLQEILTNLGNDGWECFHIDKLRSDNNRLTCKRRPKSAISYLKYIPGL